MKILWTSHLYACIVLAHVLVWIDKLEHVNQLIGEPVGRVWVENLISLGACMMSAGVSRLGPDECDLCWPCDGGVKCSSRCHTCAHTLTRMIHSAVSVSMSQIVGEQACGFVGRQLDATGWQVLDWLGQIRWPLTIIRAILERFDLHTFFWQFTVEYRGVAYTLYVPQWGR